MQDNLMQAQTQPFVKLAQSNMDLFTKFSTSPEVTKQATANANQWLQQATESAGSVMNSGAFAQLMQGMLKNYTEFLTELGHTSMAVMSQSQALLVRQAQEAGDSVVDASETRVRRGRQAA